MQVSEALEILGAKRVIWIDDRFNTTPEQTATLLTNGLETAMACAFPELQETLEGYEVDAAGTVQAVAQILTDLPPERTEEIRTAFFARERADRGFATNELSSEAVSCACQLLGVSEADRWTFDKADQDLPGLCEAGDAELSYVVDLNESGGSPTRGLDMLQALWTGNSKGTAFILTHETDISGEAKTEQSLREKLLETAPDLDGLGLPVCVIAKERLLDKAEDADGMAAALRVGVKRAGLRRSMHEVLARARGKLHAAIDQAALNLLTVPPEQLESHVFERGYKEGVSELHVVERAITAHLGKEAREFFGADDQVISSAQRLRSLRAIPLDLVAASTEPHLAAFREAEVWEEDELLNRALTPIACGDVFELDPDEQATKASKQKFILLGQPCDISLRPTESKRQQDTAFLIPLKVKPPATETDQKGEKKDKEDVKKPPLPFILRGEQWLCDFRNTTVVRLSILDLASFRADGRVRIDDGHTASAALLPAQQKVYGDRTKPVSDALADANLRPADGKVPLGLQLTFASTDTFKHIFSPVFVDASTTKANGKTTTRPKRATWRLRRCGRVRMPYAAAVLDLYTSVMRRQAFDLDFMSPGLQAVAPPVPAKKPVALAQPAEVPKAGEEAAQ